MISVRSLQRIDLAEGILISVRSLQRSERGGRVSDPIKYISLDQNH